MQCGSTKKQNDQTNTTAIVSLIPISPAAKLAPSDITALILQHFEAGKKILDKGLDIKPQGTDRETERLRNKPREKAILTQGILIEKFDTAMQIINTQKSPDMTRAAIGQAALIDSKMIETIINELLKLTTEIKKGIKEAKKREERAEKLEMINLFPYTSVLVKFQEFIENKNVWIGLLATSQAIRMIEETLTKYRTFTRETKKTEEKIPLLWDHTKKEETKCATTLSPEVSSKLQKSSEIIKAIEERLTNPHSHKKERTRERKPLSWNTATQFKAQLEKDRDLEEAETKDLVIYAESWRIRFERPEKKVISTFEPPVSDNASIIFPEGLPEI